MRCPSCQHENRSNAKFCEDAPHLSAESAPGAAANCAPRPSFATSVVRAPWPLLLPCRRSVVSPTTPPNISPTRSCNRSPHSKVSASRSRYCLQKVRDTRVRMSLELQQAFGLQIIETPAPSSCTNWTAHSRVRARPAVTPVRPAVCIAKGLAIPTASSFTTSVATAVTRCLICWTKRCRTSGRSGSRTLPACTTPRKAPAEPPDQSDRPVCARSSDFQRQRTGLLHGHAVLSEKANARGARGRKGEFDVQATH